MAHHFAFVCALALIALVSAANARRNPFTNPLPYYPEVDIDSASDAGPALFVSKFLDKPDLAQEMTRVHLGDLYSYSGFFTVDQPTNSNLFYWFFPAQSGDVNAPVLLWLQGGPGGSSLFGLFAENGPYDVTDDLTLVPKNVTWNARYHMLYVDNPVGTGFSFTDSEDGYSSTQTEIAANLHSLLQQFFTVYYQYKKSDFYITGESYAGKYIPALAHYIHEANKGATNGSVINLKGLAIGDGLCDPITQATQYANLAFYTGLADLKQQEVMQAYQDSIVKAIQAGDYMKCNDYFTLLINGPPDYFTNITGALDYYDIRKTVEPSYGGNFVAFVNQSSVRASLHVGNRYFQDSDAVYNHLKGDICRSIKNLLPTLLENYKVMFYNGQFDFIVGPSLTEVFIRTIDWPGIKGYLEIDRLIWKVDSADVEVAGYVRQYKTLTQVMVRGAGHILPFDQPARAYDMITRFVEDMPWMD